MKSPYGRWIQFILSLSVYFEGGGQLTHPHPVLPPQPLLGGLYTFIFYTFF